MSGKHLRWLYEELPKLIDEGVLTHADGKRLHDHYGPAPEIATTRVALVLCSILGATLVGSGIILLLAHNWEYLSRPARTVVAFVPLLIGQGLAGWTIIAKDESASWREGSAIFLATGIGASIAIIGQTYHIPGNLANFLITWLVLGIPIIYLLRSTTAAAFYIIGTTSWAISAQSQGGHALWYVPLMIALVPHFYFILRKPDHSTGKSLLVWVLCLNLCISLGVVLEKMLPGVWIPTYAALFTSMILAGRIWRDQPHARAFTVVGTVGAVVISTMLTFDDVWREVGYYHYRYGRDYYFAASLQDYAITLGLIALTISLALKLFRERDQSFWKWVAFPVLATILFAVQNPIDAELPADVAMILFNIYLFALGVLTMMQGIREGKLSVTNGGMAILAVYFTVRFFDSELGFAIRGIAFIIIGIGFLLANIMMASRMRERAGDQS